MQPEQEFFTSRTRIYSALLTVLVSGVGFALSASSWRIPGLYPGYALVPGIIIGLSILTLCAAYREYKYPAFRIFEDRVEALSSYEDYELFTRFKNYNVIPLSDVTGISRHGKWYIGLSTGPSTVHNLFLGRLSRKDQKSIRSLLAEKMGLPEIAS